MGLMHAIVCTTSSALKEDFSFLSFGNAARYRFLPQGGKLRNQIRDLCQRALGAFIDALGTSLLSPLQKPRRIASLYLLGLVQTRPGMALPGVHAPKSLPPTSAYCPHVLLQAVFAFAFSTLYPFRRMLPAAGGANRGHHASDKLLSDALHHRGMVFLSVWLSLNITEVNLNSNFEYPQRMRIVPAGVPEGNLPNLCKTDIWLTQLGWRRNKKREANNRQYFVRM